MNKQLKIDFERVVTDYRNLIVGNYYSRMGDGDDTKPQEKKMVELFKESPKELREGLLLLVLKVVGRPDDSNADSRLDAYLQTEAFERLDELEKV